MFSYSCKNVDERVEHIERVVELIVSIRFRLNILKCEFVKESVRLLGRAVCRGYSSVDESILSGIKDFFRSRNRTKFHRFLGATGYYQQ